MSHTSITPPDSAASPPTDPFQEFGRRLTEMPWAEDDDDGLPFDSGGAPGQPGYTIQPLSHRE